MSIITAELYLSRGFSVEQKYNRLIEQLNAIKERLLTRIREDKEERERSLKQQLDAVLHLDVGAHIQLLEFTAII